MLQVKSQIFLYLTKRQKSSLCTFLKSFVKLNKNLSHEEILNKFIEDETYYNDIGNPHFHFVIENLENEDFMQDLKKCIEAILLDIIYKEKQKPYLEEMKKKAKESALRVRDFKLKHEKPTLKQIKYYKSLCKNHKIELKDTQNASRYDLKTWIGEILDNANK